jgi:hypothetical protein
LTGLSCSFGFFFVWWRRNHRDSDACIWGSELFQMFGYSESAGDGNSPASKHIEDAVIAADFDGDYVVLDEELHAMLEQSAVGAAFEG